MKPIAIVAIVLIVIIVGAIGAYAYTQTQSQNPQATPTPTTSSPSPSAAPSPSPGTTPKPGSSPTSTAGPTAAPTATPAPTPTPTPSILRVSTTTSLRDTGLEDIGIAGNTTGTIKQAFEAKYPWITVNFIAQGTGAAIASAQRGDADMILVHSPSQELTFLTGGYGVDRKIIAYNFFIIVGPANDPAGVKGMTDVSAALQKIYTSAQTNSQVQWFTRNDGSGTATAETTLWKNAGYNYTTLVNTQTSWFHASGQGMGATLQIANNGIGGGASGYILADTGTYLAYFDQGNIQLVPEIQAQQALLNVYSAIIDDPRNVNLTATNFDAALTFVNYLVSAEGQTLIENYGTAVYHQSLFKAFVPLASGTAPNATLLSWIQGYAYINSNNQISASGTECPAAFRYNAGTLYSPSYDTVSLQNLNMQINIQTYYVTGRDPTVTPPATYSQGNAKTYKA